ncbi:hypothetical protein [Pseudomonas fluorescens]|uniref:Uncharacterized protein n=1 Tax=Pseudomonas fluorescens TaxID=294 RepID=A0A5E7EUV5_PSEFL|nr:hypothetical protein [Pseudomonas fluorescens]VVO30715.1 hypothetical protein PS723_04968 [Pseudomonas fluorescens]
MTTPRTTSQIACDALENLEIAKRSLRQLEVLLCLTSNQSDVGQRIRDLIDIGRDLAADAANTASCHCEEIGQQLNVATQNARSQNVSRTAEMRT